MEKGKVSIIIPTYKRSDRIGRAIKSALNQVHNNFEVIVVDDNEPNSKERNSTEMAVKEFIDNKNFKYIQHETNKNGSAARNTGIKASQGEYITFLDDDDEYYPNKISVQSSVLNSLDYSWGACYTGYRKNDQYGNEQLSAERSEGNVIIQALTKNLFLGSGSNFMVRRSVVYEINGFDESFQRNQDLEFLVRILMKYKIKSVQEETFLIHNEIREKEYTYEELIEINKKYRIEFKKFIEGLPFEQQNEVIKILDLWDIRAAISTRNIFKAFKIFNKSKLTLIDFTKYIFYIIHRILTKKSYGFKL